MQADPPKALLMDLDGVLYHGNRVLPHARAFLDALSAVPTVFLTNNPIVPPAKVAERLHGMGFDRVTPAQILTSAEATAAFLHARKPGFRYFAVGARGLDLALRRYGVPDREAADFVVVGEGPGLDFDSLTTGINLVVKGAAELISTNPDNNVDATVDDQHRVLPGGGALVAAFEVACGCRALTVGKPEPLLYQMALARLAVSAADCLMIGDRPDTDMLGAQRLGMATALVRTGRFSRGDAWPRGQHHVDWDCDNLAELLAAWAGRWPGWLRAM